MANWALWLRLPHTVTVKVSARAVVMLMLVWGESTSSLTEVVVDSIEFLWGCWTEGLISSPEASLSSPCLGPLPRAAYSVAALNKRESKKEGGKDRSQSLLL